MGETTTSNIVNSGSRKVPKKEKNYLEEFHLSYRGYFSMCRWIGVLQDQVVAADHLFVAADDDRPERAAAAAINGSVGLVDGFRDELVVPVALPSCC
jgi:hypothetical protein